jgi:hypothetical protein
MSKTNQPSVKPKPKPKPKAKPKIKELPLSGAENKFTNRRWSSDKGIPNNNCYAYAIGDYEAYRWQKSIPGDRSGLSNIKHDYTTCKDLPRRVISDNPKTVYKVDGDKKCKKGYFKMMMFVSSLNIKLKLVIRLSPLLRFLRSRNLELKMVVDS